MNDYAGPRVGGFEKFAERGLNSGGGIRYKGKGRSVFNRGPLKGKTQDEAYNWLRDRYKRLSDADKQKYESMASGHDVRSQRELDAIAQANGGTVRSAKDKENNIVYRNGRMYSGPAGGINGKAPNSGLDASNIQDDPNTQLQEAIAKNEGMRMPAFKGTSSDNPITLMGSPSPTTPQQQTPSKPVLNTKKKGGIIDTVTNRAKEFATSIGDMFKGRDAGESSRDMSKPTFAGDKRILLSPDEEPPEGAVLVGMSNGKRIYEMGAGIASASETSAATTAKRYEPKQPSNPLDRRQVPNGMASNFSSPIKVNPRAKRPARSLAGASTVDANAIVSL